MNASNNNSNLRYNLMMAISVLALLGAAWTYIAPRLNTPNLPALPEPPVEGLPDVVRNQIEQAYAKVHETPNHPGANGVLGMILHANTQLDAASICYQRARILAPQSFEWAHYTGMALKRAGRDDEARQHLTDALRLNPDYIASRLALAEIELSSSRLPEALALYQSAIAQAPKSPHAKIGLGKTLSAMGDSEKGLSHYRETVSLAPGFGEAHYALALAYRESGDSQRAAEHMALYRKNEGRGPPRRDPLLGALNKLKRSGKSIVINATAKMKQGQFDEAAKLYEQALNIDPQLIEAHGRLIDVYQRLGKHELSKQHFDLAIEKNPEAVVAYVTYASALIGQKRYTEATELAQKASTLNPSLAIPYIFLGQIEELEGRAEEAIAHFEQALGHNPKSRIAAFSLGKNLMFHGDRAKAEALLQQSLEPDDLEASAYYIKVAQVYEAAGERSAALNYLNSARERATTQKEWKKLATIEQINRRWLERSQEQ